MYGAIVGHGFVDCLAIRFVVEEGAICNRLINTGDILVDNAAGTEAHMADFRVAHLSLGQANIEAGARYQSPRCRVP